MVKLTNMENEKMNESKNELYFMNRKSVTTKFNTCADTIHLLTEEYDNTDELIEQLNSKYKENQAVMEKNSKYVGASLSTLKANKKKLSSVEVYSKLEEQNKKINLKITKLQFILAQIKSSIDSLDNVWKKLYIFEEAYEEAIDELS
tara:strand:- start:6503 stop:6943 length:441 start_codon:yes stop_codon:yes gene_type:complete